MNVKELAAVLLQMLTTALPIHLRWIAGLFVQLFSKHVESKVPDQTLMAAAPDDLKKQLSVWIDEMIAKIQSPFIRAIARRVGVYVTTVLADSIWDRLFAPAAPDGASFVSAETSLEETPDAEQMASALDEVVAENAF